MSQLDLDDNDIFLGDSLREMQNTLTDPIGDDALYVLAFGDEERIEINYPNTKGTFEQKGITGSRVVSVGITPYEDEVIIDRRVVTDSRLMPFGQVEVSFENIHFLWQTTGDVYTTPVTIVIHRGESIVTYQYDPMSNTFNTPEIDLSDKVTCQFYAKFIMDHLSRVDDSIVAFAEQGE